MAQAEPEDLTLYFEFEGIKYGYFEPKPPIIEENRRLLPWENWQQDFDRQAREIYALGPTLPFVYIGANRMEDRMRLRREYPGTYPPFRLDFEVSQYLWRSIVDHRAANLQFLEWDHLERLLRGLPGHLLMDLNDELEAYDLGKRGDGDFVVRTIESMRRMRDEAKAMYERAGYRFMYWIAVKQDDVLFQANQGLIPLTPDTFEAGSITYPFALDAVTILKDRGYVHSGLLSREHRHRDMSRPFLGWTKRTVLAAIKDSGLWQYQSVENPGRRNWPRVLPRAALGITIRPDINIPHLSVGRNLWMNRYNKYITSFGAPWQNRIYYESVYRLIYDTLAKTDWKMMCDMDLYGITQLRHIAVANFNQEKADVRKLDKPQLCNLLAQISETREKYSKEIVSAFRPSSDGTAPFATRAMMYKPNTFWDNKESEAWPKLHGGEKALTHPYEQFAFVKMLCSDKSIDKDTMLRRLWNVGIRNLLPENMDPYDRDDICDYLLEQIGYQAEKYEFLMFDCDNSYIEKRHILATVYQMDLGGVLKDVDVNAVSKAELCGILNNYLQLLMEAKARRLATTN